MIGWLLACGLAVIGTICMFALGGRLRGGRVVVLPPNRQVEQDPAHRQAIHHFASGALPPWR